MKNYIFLFLILGLSFTQMSCEKFDLNTQKQEIRDRLAEEGLLDDAIETDEGIFIIFENEGTENVMPEVSSTVDVIYEGRLFETDEIFDSSWGQISRIPTILATIEGWQIGIPMFKKGQKGTLYIPAAFAYGTTNDRPGSTGVVIERGSILIFDVELVDFF